MHLETPFWWYRKKGVLASALAPLGRLYGSQVEGRFARAAPYRSRRPVVCIGNFTAGGSGKTPTAIAVARLLMGLGERPAFLTRGYGGTLPGPTLVGEGTSASEVGDEPLLLAAVAPTMVAADRVAGAKAIEATDATVIVMDDGFQNPSLHKTFSLIALDAASGIGNGLIIPAGPLRAPLAAQTVRADALLTIGDGSAAQPVVDAFARTGKPVLKAHVEPHCDPRWLSVLPAIGFAGIARPGKFFATLRANGARLIDAQSFPDHHRYTEREARRLLDAAQEKTAMLVTTEKDWTRLPDEDGTALGELKHRSRPFPIVVKFADEAALTKLLKAITRPAQDGVGDSA
ncbi:MAG: tetraacyldisaccharide 4'-kinase [Methyloceanibacter sp.]